MAWSSASEPGREREGATFRGPRERARLPLAALAVFLAVVAATPPLRAEGPVPTPRPTPDRRIADARALAKGGRVSEARKILARLVESDPGNREARKGLLEVAALMKDWNECNAQTAAVEPFADGEEIYMFYAAVALRETGSIASARTLVVRARPFLVASPFVDWYTREILGN